MRAGVPDALRCSLAAIQAVVRHAHAIAHADPVEGLLEERCGATVSQLHRHAVVLVAAAAALHLVAHDSTADSSGDRRGIVPAATADLASLKAAVTTARAQLRVTQ